MIERSVGIIGCGTMGGALLGGLLEAGVIAPDRLYGSDASEERRRAMADRIGGNVFDENRALAARSDVVVLAVKPHVVPAVAEEIADALTPDHLLVSLAAGVGLEALKSSLKTDRVIRVMPNTPAMVGAGAAAYCAASGATDDDAALVEELLGAVGKCVRVREEHMDAVTGLSGSGPAYVYVAIEALSDGAVKMGLPRQQATRLAAQTVLGAARMVLETGKHPGELKDAVTTPGGTTIAGLHALERAGVRRAFMDAVEAATQRSDQLSGG